MKAYNFRFNQLDVDLWRARAEMAGLTLTEWIRRRCNGESIESGLRSEPKSGLAADLLADIRESIEAHKAAPVDMKKLLP